MKAAILYSSFFNPDGTERVIGGIQTYLLNVARVCKEMGIEPTIYQWSNQPFEKIQDEIVVRGIPVLHLPYKRRPSSLFASVLREVNECNDIVVFGSDSQSVRSNCKRAISIQHGIGWDLPARFLTSHTLCQGGVIGSLYKACVRRRFIQYYERCPNRVCVDYNFPNWYRTYLVSELPGRNWIITNFTRVPSADEVESMGREDGVTRILFARRFCEFRGTRIMAVAVRSVLASRSNVELTFAGEGPDENWLRQCFAGESHVRFIKYDPDESLKIHLNHHLSLIHI